MNVPKTEIATFGAGCFWHVQEAFDRISGVVKTEVGYMGGKMNNSTYEDVCSGETGHAEVCQVEFNPSKTTFEKLLELFWDIHNPTQINRQGLDIGTQYRSAIFYHNEQQKKIAEKSKQKMEKSKKHLGKIATQIVPATKFFKAEDYHQKYYKQHGKVC